MPYIIFTSDIILMWEQAMKKLFIDKQLAEEIIKDYKTPFHIYDEEAIINNCINLKKAFSWNRGFKEYFAVKANPNPYLLKLFKKLGCGMDCSSYVELKLCDKLGITGEDIMFSSNATPAEEYIYARELNSIINLDDISHIDFLGGITSIPDTISVRYNPGGEFTVNNRFMDTPREAKYGFTRAQLSVGLKKFKMLGVKRFGLHSFLASNTIGNDYYPEIARILFKTAVELKKELDIEISFINLSGGIGIPYRPDQEANNIELIGKGVKDKYEQIMIPNGLGDVAIYTELGRFMTGPYGMLISTVLHKKQIYKDYIGLDASAANLMRPAMYGAYHHISVLGKESKPLTHKYDITGSLCENNDKFAVDRLMPEIEIGDIVAIHDTGAHGYAMGYNYNGKLRSAEIILHKDKTYDLIRRAETEQDYFATFDIYEEFKA